MDQWKLKTDPGHVRAVIFRRDKGRCANCGLDTDALRRAVQTFEDLANRHHYGRLDIPPKPAIDVDLAMLLAKFKCSGRDSYWDADHIKPVAQGGGECGIENYQTLCVWCHRGKTAAQVRKEPEGTTTLFQQKVKE